MTTGTKSEFTSHCRIAAKTNLLLFLFQARLAYARYSSRMMDRFLNWGDHGKPKSGKIKGRCQPPLGIVFASFRIRHSTFRIELLPAGQRPMEIEGSIDLTHPCSKGGRESVERLSSGVDSGDLLHRLIKAADRQDAAAPAD